MNIKTIAAAAVLIAVSHLVTGQDKLHNTVILYNVVPLRVDLNQDGSIKNVYGEDVNYLRGYTW